MMNFDDDLIVSIKEARKLLGKDANGMTDDEIIHVITTLDLLAKDALQEAKIKLRRKRDAKALANVVYDIYKDEKRTKNGSKKST